jgi:hypothetical protein
MLREEKINENGANSNVSPSDLLNASLHVKSKFKVTGFGIYVCSFSKTEL